MTLYIKTVRNWFRYSLPLSMSTVVDEISGENKNEASCFDFSNQIHSPHNFQKASYGPDEVSYGTKKASYGPKQDCL